ncbi:hypothetical protein [Kutzneria buriramensis]|uniref:Uncharacterized protein n=1 Tax=Kutzneria buriramensis TaxID=1045776 RepID=A0A3E0HPT9_9PSEU|nr:hypothetical protein [Kutzneria buriramensis]REH48290.1 hypothetical protein BCF44_105148 [Kutzneria buriramensis]
MSASDLCSHIVNHLEHETPHTYAYGASPKDAILVGGEHTTTVLSTQAGEARWFRIVIEEFHPDTDDPLWLDYSLLRTLARRAGIPEPVFRLGPGV